MQGPGARGRTHLPAAALCLLLGASGCYAVPPPLMYPGTPVPAGHLGFGGAVAGSIMPGAYDTPPRLFVAPGLELSVRYGVAPGLSLGLRVLGGGGAMLDGRFEVLHTPHLSLSLGLEAGAVLADTYCVAPPGAFCTDNVGYGPALLGLGSVPVVLGWRVGRTTIQLGFRPGARLPQQSNLTLVGTTGPQNGTASAEALAGVLLGVSTPAKGIGHFHLELDVTRSFVHPGTVFALALGLSR